MTTGPARVPNGFRVRLHDDVRVGPSLQRGARLLRLAPGVLDELMGREVTVGDELSAALAARLLDLDLAVPVLGRAEPFTLDDVTVVIPVRERADGVDRLLGALGGKMRAVVVDDASVDAQGLLRVARRHAVDLVRLPQNIGPAGARNVGLRRVRTRLVAFVDSDVTIAPHGFEVLLAHFNDPGLAAVAPRVLSSRTGTWFQRYETVQGGLDLGGVPAAVRQWSAVAYVPSACLLARVADVTEGFDEALRSGEDVDLVWRLIASGRRVRHEPAVVAHHDSRDTLAQWLAQRFHYGTSAAPLADRHGPAVAPAVLTPAQAALLLGLMLPRGWGRWASLVAGALVVVEGGRQVPRVRIADRALQGLTVLSLTVRQAVGLLLRHGAPASAATALVSSRMRRGLFVVAVVEGALAWHRDGRSVGAVPFIAGRRLSMAAYGLGVWVGAWRARSVRALLPHVTRRRPKCAP